MRREKEKITYSRRSGWIIGYIIVYYEWHSAMEAWVGLINGKIGLYCPSFWDCVKFDKKNWYYLREKIEGQNQRNCWYFA